MFVFVFSVYLFNPVVLYYTAYLIARSVHFFPKKYFFSKCRHNISKIDRLKPHGKCHRLSRKKKKLKFKKTYFGKKWTLLAINQVSGVEFFDFDFWVQFAILNLTHWSWMSFSFEEIGMDIKIFSDLFVRSFDKRLFLVIVYIFLILFLARTLN